MSTMHPTLDFRIDAFRPMMDEPTFELFTDWCRHYQEDTMPYPFAMLSWMLDDYGYWGKQIGKENLYEYYYDALEFDELYALLYKIQAFTLYGYGNWSNNDRKRKGLQPVRFKQV